MRLAAAGYAETAGLWEPKDHRIVIKRSELRSPETYAGTLLHEVAHAVSGTPDVSAAFEDALTAEIGTVANKASNRRISGLRQPTSLEFGYGTGAAGRPGPRARRAHQ